MPTAMFGNRESIPQVRAKLKAQGLSEDKIRKITDEMLKFDGNEAKASIYDKTNSGAQGQLGEARTAGLRGPKVVAEPKIVDGYRTLKTSSLTTDTQEIKKALISQAKKFKDANSFKESFRDAGVYDFGLSETSPPVYEIMGKKIKVSDLAKFLKDNKTPRFEDFFSNVQ
jgi:hypothetical protein